MQLLGVGSRGFGLVTWGDNYVCLVLDNSATGTLCIHITHLVRCPPRAAVTCLLSTIQIPFERDSISDLKQISTQHPQNCPEYRDRRREGKQDK